MEGMVSESRPGLYWAHFLCRNLGPTRVTQHATTPEFITHETVYKKGWSTVYYYFTKSKNCIIMVNSEDHHNIRLWIITILRIVITILRIIRRLALAKISLGLRPPRCNSKELASALGSTRELWKRSLFCTAKIGLNDCPKHPKLWFWMEKWQNAHAPNRCVHSIVFFNSSIAWPGLWSSGSCSD